MKRENRLRSRVATGVSALGVGALVVLGAAAPATATPGGDAEGAAQFVGVNGLTLDVAELASTHAVAPGGPELETAEFDAAFFGALTDQVALLQGNHGKVPLVNSGGAGLLSISQTDVAGFASAPDTISSGAASGAIDPATGEFAPTAGGATLNLASLFDGLGVSAATQHVLSQIDLDLEGIASSAGAGSYAGVVNDYQLDSMKLQLTSPLLAELPSVIDLSLEGASLLAAEALELIAPGGIVPLPGGGVPPIDVLAGTIELGAVTLQVTAPNFDSVVSDVMNAPGGVIVQSDDGIATVNLGTGEISVDLAPLFGGAVNELPANTEVFTDANMAAISAAVANALSKTTGLFTGGVLSALHATHLGVSIDADFRMNPSSVTPNLNGLVVASGALSGSGSIDDFANGTSVFTSTFAQVPGLPTCASQPVWGVCLTPTNALVGATVVGINSAVPSVAPAAVQLLVSPFMTALNDIEAQIEAEIAVVVADVYGEITSAFDWLMPSLASVIVNEQPAVGDLGSDSFTVRAVSATLLPNMHFSAQQKLSLASSTVQAIADPAIALAEAEVQPSDTVNLSGVGWNPAGGPVTLTFEDSANQTLGEPVEVEVAADGSISATWQVPANTKAGSLTVTATQADLVRTATTDVVVPAKPAPPVRPAASGSALPKTGGEPLFILGASALLLALTGAGVVVARKRKA